MASLDPPNIDSQLMASVIIPSYNGAGKIPGLLEALACQTIMEFEVVLVIDGSTDNTAQVAERYGGRFRRLVVISRENGGRAMARNTGASQATADLLIFYDDDMVPYSDSVEKHIIFHCKHEGIVCGHPFETTEPHHTDIQNYKAWLTHKWTGRYSDGITTMNTDDLFFTASNCSITKAIFNTLKGFDDNLTDAEDYELAYRCLGIGISVYYDKENLARHADSITCRGYIQRLREYGRAHKKIADTSQHHPAPNNGLVLVPRRIVYRCFAFAFWPKIIDAGALRFLPKNFRYRLYSMIIHALANEHANVSL